MKHLDYRTLLSQYWRKGCTMILAFCWCSGLLLGCFFAQRADIIHFSMMRRAVSCSMSIVSLVIVLFPFLLSALAVYLFKTWLFLPVCFLKAFSFAYTAGMVTSSFGSAGWLVRLLLFFTDVCTIPLLLWIWVRWIGAKSQKAFREIIYCSVISLLVGSIDYFVVSPFLGMLI